MRRTITRLVGLGFLFGVAGCAAIPRWDDTKVDGSLIKVPEPVLALAAPFQDTRVVKLEPSTYCFWYLHKGPVEDTFLPLRTPDGSFICAAKPFWAL